MTEYQFNFAEIIDDETVEVPDGSIAVDLEGGTRDGEEVLFVRWLEPV